MWSDFRNIANSIELNLLIIKIHDYEKNDTTSACSLLP